MLVVSCGIFHRRGRKIVALISLRHRLEFGALTFVERRHHLFRRAGGGAPR